MTASSPTPQRRRAPRWVRILGFLAAILVTLVAILSIAATLVIRGALPQTRGDLAISTAHGTITVTRDTYGVPHIAATDAHDAYLAQGYVTAQDRLWQMDFNRRVAAGRLSEILGPSTAATDKYLRTLGLTRSAVGDIANLKPALRDELTAYTEGVNAFIDTHKDSLPLEFRILGYTPETWTNVDSLSYGKVISLSLDGTFNTKLARMDVLAQAGPQAAAQLFPAYPNDNPTLLDGTGNNVIPLGTSETTYNPKAASALFNLTPIQQSALGHLPTAAQDAAQWIRQQLGNLASVEGSNDWVVSGAHTTTGKPIVANDPHLGINYPSIWYEVALKTDTIDEVGFSFPGIPGIIIGHNAYIAWGVTNGQVDNTDLYIEKLSSDGTQYLYDGKMLPIVTRTETIKVKGAADQTLLVQSTQHGPILNSISGQLKDHPEIAPISLKWTALQPEYSFAGFFELGMAQNIDQFQAAIRDISISQNFVFADTQGNIGYRLSGWVPIRLVGNGLLPVDGTTSANEWTGQVAFDKMPHVLNPSSGIILTANNRLVSADYPYYITNDWDIGYRAHRIEQLLTAKPVLSPDDIAAIQNDIHSLPAEQIVPAYLQAAQNDSSKGAATASKLFTGWNFELTRDSAAAAMYAVTTSYFIQDAVKSAIHGTTYTDWLNNEYGISQLLLGRNLVTNPQAPLLDGTSARDAAVVKAENEAFDYLSKFFKTGDTSQWHWGTLHQAHFDHPLAAAVDALRLVFPNQSVGRPGDVSTVNVGGDGGFVGNDYSQASLPSMREIIDLGNFDQSRFITTTGESGQSFAAHNFDMLPLWDQGKYQPMWFTAAAVSANTQDVLTIHP